MVHCRQRPRWLRVEMESQVEGKQNEFVSETAVSENVEMTGETGEIGEVWV